ncbi:MAG TPA: hypothetical protein VFX23_15030 [Limnobacter sp.]|uniref:hypothetical protein n=1 Tax=Limnobacter sp. TaxID=2003368 RepID=UPI002E358919|nr:hypothetical protein [Limnobacter sp.]HEX5487299.1 hypothetical protein [Limnobacter sp.]
MALSVTDTGHIDTILHQAEDYRKHAIDQFQAQLKKDSSPEGIAKAASDLKMALGAAQAGFNSAKEIADFVKDVLSRVTGG